MKKIQSLLVAVFISTLAISAQESGSIIRELGIYTGGFNAFGISYKSGTENSLFRLSVTPFSSNITQNKTGSEAVDHHNYNECGFNLGFEKRKPISPALSFYIGSDLLNSFSSSNSKGGSNDYKSNNWGFSTGLGLVVGFNYKINEIIGLSAEAVPSVLYSYSHSKTKIGLSETISKSSGVNFGFRGSDINLSLLFSLGKKN